MQSGARVEQSDVAIRHLTVAFHMEVLQNLSMEERDVQLKHFFVKERFPTKHICSNFKTKCSSVFTFFCFNNLLSESNFLNYVKLF